jgi:hypothetical protein
MATFREAAAEEFGWKTQDFEANAFLHCLDPFPRFIARLLWPWRDRLFREDIAAMRMVSELTSYNDIFQIAQGFGDARRDHSFLRDRMGVRPRGRRLLAFAREILPGRKSRDGKVESAYAPGATWRTDGFGAGRDSEAGESDSEPGGVLADGIGEAAPDQRLVKKPKASSRPATGISAWRKKPGSE